MYVMRLWEISQENSQMRGSTRGMLDGCTGARTDRGSTVPFWHRENDRTTKNRSFWANVDPGSRGRKSVLDRAAPPEEPTRHRAILCVLRGTRYGVSIRGGNR